MHTYAKIAAVAVILSVIVGAGLISLHSPEQQAIQLSLDSDQIWNGSDSDRSWYDDGADSFTISTAAELKGFADIVNIDDKMFAGKTVTLGADIDLDGHIWVPIGNYVSDPVRSAFKGTFDGDGHTVYNLYIDEGYTARSGSAWMGFFTMVRDNATIKNLTLADARLNLLDNPNQAGILAAMLYDSHVINCHVSGTIVTVNPSKWLGNGEYIGGMIGAVHSETYASMSRCSADVIMDCYGQASAGGLVGTAGFNGYSKPNAKIDISDCFTTGIIKVSTKNEQFLVAGLIGFMGDIYGGVTTKSVSLFNSYSTAEIISSEASILTSNIAINARGGFVEKCYWDTSIHTMAGILEGGGITAANNQGKTTTEMRSAAFVDLLNDGRSSIWFQNTGSTPSLSPPPYHPIEGSVVITGVLQSDRVLTATTTGLPDALGSLNYTWFRSGSSTPLQSGAQNTYLTVAADIGCTITVQVSAEGYDGTIQYTTGVIVKAPQETRRITAYANAGSTIYPAGVSQVVYGGSVTYEYSAKQGYEIIAVVIDGVQLITVPETYTFSNVVINHTISIYSAIPPNSSLVSVEFDERFGQVEFVIDGVFSSIYTKPFWVMEGVEVTLRATALEGGEFNRWEGAISDSADSITISSVTEDMFLTAEFSEKSDNTTIYILAMILILIVILAGGVIVSRRT